MPVTPLKAGDPARVGPHRLLGRLGQGGAGTVYLGVSPDDRAVAVKVLREEILDPLARSRFRHELAALRRVRGPHLVEVLDADVDADLPYLVTRFVPGQRLDEVVTRSGPLMEAPLTVVAQGIAEALATLHAAGVVHRDLTPGNVLVLDGEPHVIDLGLAVAADVTALTRSGLIAGTPGYVSPEQVLGEPVTSGVDVHAWGATVALAGTGRPPYGTGRPEALLYRIVHGEPDLVGLPPRLARLVAAAMHRDPQVRPDAPELLHELRGDVAIPADLPAAMRSDVAATQVIDLAATTDVIRRPQPAGSTRLLDAPTAAPPLHRPSPAGPVAWPVQPPSYPPRPSPAPDEPYDQAADTDQDRTAEPARTDDHDAYDDPSPAPGRGAQLLTTIGAALTVLAASALVAPVLTCIGVLFILVLLRTITRSSERLQLRRERRGDRRRDGAVAALGAPWHVGVAALDTALTLPLLAVAAALPAGLMWLAAPEVYNGLEPPELTAATAIVTATVVALSRRSHAGSRRLLRRALPDRSGAVAAVVACLLVIAVLLLATAEGSAPSWWPLSPDL